MATKRRQNSTDEQPDVTLETHVPDAELETESARVDPDTATDAETTVDAAQDTGLEVELESTRQQVLRVQADFDNFRKRTRQEKEDLQQFATRKVFADLLPVLDNFDRALSALTPQGAADEMKTGMEMVHRQLLSVLENGGVKPMEVIGHSFDPNIHEGVMQVPADGEEVGVVVQELQRGYWLHGKVLRPAMVAVTT